MDEKLWKEMTPADRRIWALNLIGVCQALLSKSIGQIAADADRLVDYVTHGRRDEVPQSPSDDTPSAPRSEGTLDQQHLEAT